MDLILVGIEFLTNYCHLKVPFLFALASPSLFYFSVEIVIRK